jgi:hypothetical protein
MKILSGVLTLATVRLDLCVLTDYPIPIIINKTGMIQLRPINEVNTVVEKIR